MPGGIGAWRWVWIGCCCLILSGCAMWPGGMRPEPLQRAPLWESWDLRATLLARGQRNARLSMRWEQRGEFFRCVLSGPFGLGATEFNGTPERVEIRYGEQRWLSTNPAADLARMTGVELPLDTLQAWLLGVPEPRFQGRLVDEWSAQGWTVEVVSREQVEQAWVPSELRLYSAEQEVSLSRMRWAPPSGSGL